MCLAHRIQCIEPHSGRTCEIHEWFQSQYTSLQPLWYVGGWGEGKGKGGRPRGEITNKVWVEERVRVKTPPPTPIHTKWRKLADYVVPSHHFFLSKQKIDPTWLTSSYCCLHIPSPHPLPLVREASQQRSVCFVLLTQQSWYWMFTTLFLCWTN